MLELLGSNCLHKIKRKNNRTFLFFQSFTENNRFHLFVFQLRKQRRKGKEGTFRSWLQTKCWQVFQVAIPPHALQHTRIFELLLFFRPSSVSTSSATSRSRSAANSASSSRATSPTKTTSSGVTSPQKVAQPSEQEKTKSNDRYN